MFLCISVTITSSIPVLVSGTCVELSLSGSLIGEFVWSPATWTSVLVDYPSALAQATDFSVLTKDITCSMQRRFVLRLVYYSPSQRRCPRARSPHSHVASVAPRRPCPKSSLLPRWMPKLPSTPVCYIVADLLRSRQEWHRKPTVRSSTSIPAAS